MSDGARDPLPEPAMTRMERKAQKTDEAFRSIVSSEVAARERKTARLRALRLAREAAEAEAAAAEQENQKRKKASGRGSRAR